MEYAFLTNPKQQGVHAGVMRDSLSKVNNKVAAVTLATHTNPWVVFVRCTEALSDDEKARIGEVIHSL